jgi:peroxiredoxin
LAGWDGLRNGTRLLWSGLVTTNLSAETAEQVFVRCRDMDGSLNQRLQAFADGLRRANAPFSEAVDRLIERLQRSGAGRAAPGLGEVMPPFVLPDEAGRMVSLESLLRHGPVAITFHRGHWCPYCRISIKALVQAYNSLKGSGAQIIAIMPDRQEFAAEFKAAADAPFPILTDLDNGYAMSLNLVVWVGTEMERFMTSIGRRLPDYQGNDSWMLPLPATFVVRRDGRIKARFIDPDYRKRAGIEEVLRALRSDA